MKISRFAPILGAAVLLSATTLAFTVSGARAQDNSIFGSQQDESSISPDKKAPPLTITGEWSGSLDDNLAGPGTLDADFTETSNGTLGGTWSFAFSEGTDFGTIKGKATSDKVDITFIFAKKKPYVHCRFSIKTSDASDSEISGNYKFAACGPLTKQEFGSLDISPD